MAAQVDEVRRVARRAYWRAPNAQVVVDAWRRSGESAAGFARRYDLDPQRITRWAKELEAPQDGVLFHSVKIVDRGALATLPAVDRVIEIVLVGGRRVRVPPGVDPADLRRVLDVVEEARSC